MREISRIVFELDLKEGKAFEKEAERLKISKIDLFRLMWKAYKEKQSNPQP
jgi:hypothetical protein